MPYWYHCWWPRTGPLEEVVVATIRITTSSTLDLSNFLSLSFSLDHWSPPLPALTPLFLPQSSGEREPLLMIQQQSAVEVEVEVEALPKKSLATHLRSVSEGKGSEWTEADTASCSIWQKTGQWSNSVGGGGGKTWVDPETVSTDLGLLLLLNSPVTFGSGRRSWRQTAANSKSTIDRHCCRCLI